MREHEKAICDITKMRAEIAALRQEKALLITRLQQKERETNRLLALVYARKETRK